jgi:hypothetical protein
MRIHKGAGQDIMRREGREIMTRESSRDHEK